MATAATAARRVNTKRREVFDEHALKVLREMLTRLENASARAEEVGTNDVRVHGSDSKFPAMAGYLLAECSTSASQLRLALSWLTEGE